MILNFIFFIYRDPEGLLLLSNSPSIRLLLLLPRSKIVVYHIIVWIRSTLIKCSRLWEIWGTLWLVYKSAINLLKVVFILLHHSRDNLLLIIILTWNCRVIILLESRIQTVYSYSLLRFWRTRSIRWLSKLGRWWLDLILKMSGISIWESLYLGSTSNWLFRLPMIWPQCTGSTAYFTHLLIIIIC
jgi:hypothetical protein